MPASPALAARLREADADGDPNLAIDLLHTLFGPDARTWPDAVVAVSPLKSIDAAVALVRTVAPTLSFNLSYRPPGRWWVEMWPTDRALEAEVGDIAGGALALCLALVEWRIAHGG